MSKIAKAFENGPAFIPFLTAGDPSLEKTEEFIHEMIHAGADLIEIGIPFSDPIAEGPVIQEADIRALRAGTTPDRIFEMVARLRKTTDIPMVFLTYVNPVFHYGFERFCARCEETGIDGLIIPDLPFEEKGELDAVMKRHGLDLISLIAPTSEDRISRIAAEASGYIYVVSSMGVTGVRSEIKTDLRSILDVIRKTTDVPAAIGFGINTPEQAREMTRIADGAIVGSAIVKIIAQYGDAAGPKVYEYVKMMKDAIR